MLTGKMIWDTVRRTCLVLTILYLVNGLPLIEDDYVDCETPDTEDGSFWRNGLSGDSFFTWEGKRVPYTIDESFNDTQRQKIEMAIVDFNEMFEGCLEWSPRNNDEYSYVNFNNDGSCTSKIGRAYWPFPIYQDINLRSCAHSIGHIKHEMMHAIGFYHEHNRSDRDQYIEVKWGNIQERRKSQFETFRFTTAYGEKYDYDSIMHYSSRAFSNDIYNPEVLTIVPKNGVDPGNIGRKKNYSELDIVKIKKMYQCQPYHNWRTSCFSDGECGINEYCSGSFVNPINGECRTVLADGFFCYRDVECLNKCIGGRCGNCAGDEDCPSGEYCTNKYIPLLPKSCDGYCGSLCATNSQCGGECGTCTWGFVCLK